MADLTPPPSPFTGRLGRVIRVAAMHCGFMYSGGGERIVLEEVMGLRKMGYEVDVFAPTIDFDHCFPEITRSLGMRNVLPRFPFPIPYRDAAAMVASSVLAPLIAWRFRHYDIFLCHNQPTAWIGYAMAKVLGKPYVIYLNQPNRLVYPRPVDMETGWRTKRDFELLDRIVQRIRPFVKWADFVSINKAHTILANGDYIGGVISKIYGRPTVTCAAGSHVREDDFAEPTPAPFIVNGFLIKKPYILITNRHYPQKRFDYVISVMPNILKQVDATLVITGEDTSHTPTLREQVRQLGLEGKALFVGLANERDLRLLYREAAVYVYPAPEEDFGMGVVEAMAQGMPVVAWDHAGPSVTVVNGLNGFKAKPYDLDDLADKLLILLKDPGLARQMGAQAREFVQKHYSWEDHYAIVAQAIEEALEPAPKRYTAVWEKQRLIADLPTCQRALDVGSGDGEYVPHLLERSQQLICLDYDPRRLAELRRRFSADGRVQIVQGDVQHLPFTKGAFDFTWASEIVEHQPSLSVLDELERVTSRDLLVTIPSPWGPYYRRDPTHILKYGLGQLRQALQARRDQGWRYEISGLGLCVPQTWGLNWLRRWALRLSLHRPLLAWTWLIRGQRATVKGNNQ